MGQVVLGRERVDHADPGEGDPLLTGEPGQLVDDSEAQRVVTTVERQPIHIRGCDRAVADPALRGLDLDQRLQPEHAA